MNPLNLLSSSLGRRDEVPNKELAGSIVAKKNMKVVAELVANLHNKNKAIQSDCIKVIYEIGALQPKMIAAYAKELVALLDNSNNRLQWGAMTALHYITSEDPAVVHSALPKILLAADNGSVITNDHCVGILVELCRIEEYSSRVFPLLIERLNTCPVNQLPMYAEQALEVVTPANKDIFIRTLTGRLGKMEKESREKRLEAVVRKAGKK
jgi:hypothetical protein